MKKVIITLFTFSALALPQCNKENAAPTSQNVSVLVNVQLEVGKFVYQNLEATIEVKGFDANNIEKWSKSYSYAGPQDNILSVKKGFDHYSISTEKWGVSNS